MPQLFPLDERRDTYFRRHLTALIPSGQTIQADYIDLYRGCETAVGFIFDANLTAATLSFMTAAPGDNDTPASWHDVNDQNGNAVEVAIVAGECAIISPSLLSGLRYLKLVISSEEQGNMGIVVITRPV